MGVFLAVALVASCILGALELYSRFHAFLEKELSSIRTFGNVIVIPDGHSSPSLFHHEWKQIHVQMPGLHVNLQHPVVRIHFFDQLSREMIQIGVDTVRTSVTPRLLPRSEKKATPAITHPDLWLPFRAAINIGHIQVKVDSVGAWEADSLRLTNRSQKNLALRLRSIRGKYLAEELDLRFRYQWSSQFSDATLRLSSPQGDSLWIAANATRKHLEKVSVDLALAVEKLPRWIPKPWPAQAPTLGPIALAGNFEANLIRKTIHFDSELNTKVGAFWQLPSMNCKLHLSGNEKLDIQTSLLLQGKAGQKIQIDATTDKRLNGTAQAEVQGISITLGPQTLPADAKIHRLVKEGDSLWAAITTKAGSEVLGTMKGFSTPLFRFTANIAAQEPWAVQWTRGNLQLAPPTLIEGEFHRGILSANVKTRVPYAYKVTADAFETDLTLSRRGIQFDNGTFTTRGHMHNFTGEVIWKDSIPHYTFALEQDEDRFARVYGTFTADLDLSVAGIDIGALPLADTTLLRGYGGEITGIWHHSFSQQEGRAQVSLSTELKGIPLRISATARQQKDSLIVDRLTVNQGGNQIDAHLVALLRKDSTQADSPAVRLVQAQLTTQGFDLPEMASALRDSTLRSGKVSGELSYERSSGLQGGLVFSGLTLSKVDSAQLAISRLRLTAHQQRIQLSGRLKIGQGLWDGEAELTLDNAFIKGTHRFSGAYATDNGGVLWFDGNVDSLLQQWKGNLHMNGPWFLPPGSGEISATDFSADLRIPFRGGLDSIEASFQSLHTEYVQGTLLSLPLEFKGSLQKGMLKISPAYLRNDLGERISGRMLFNIPEKKLEELSFESERFTLPLQGIHQIRLQHVSGYTQKSNQEIAVLLELPSIVYSLQDKNLGDAQALLRGQIRYHIPTRSPGSLSQSNNSIDGNIFIDKAVYRKQVEIAPDPLHLDRTFASISRFLTGLRKEKAPAKDAKAVSGRPTTLNIRINDSGRDSVMILSNFATFPLALDLTLSGTSQTPLLSGDINAVGTGFIGFDGLATFEIGSLRLFWNDQPWRQGSIEVQSSHDFPFCEEEMSNEVCPIELNINGTITNPQPLPIANCGIESSPALIYYSILLGCVSQSQQSEGFDKNKFTGRIIANLLSSTANKGLGGDYIGDISLKMHIFDNSTAMERDSSYLRIPVSLDRWVKNLSAVFGYTQDQSINPRYDQSMEVGLQYALPIFDSTETNINLIDPRLDLSANLVARRYPATVETQAEASRVEKNIGLLYNYKFWDPCILGLGRCPTTPQPPLEKDKP